MDRSPQEPLVSIVLPTKDRADLLPQTLDSVRKQVYPAWECLVIDDDSQDDTAEMIARFSREDPRLAYQRRQSDRTGAGVCRNQGLARARGKYVIFLDSDDLLAAHCLGSRVAAMEADPSLDLAVFGIELFCRVPGDLGLAFNAPSPRDDLSRFLELDAVWQTIGPIWRTEAVLRIGGWAQDLLSFQDWELHVRALAAGLRYRKFPQSDCCCRIPGGRESISMHVYSRQHLLSHVRLLEKVHRSLRANSRLCEPYRRRLAGLYLWLAQRLQSAGECDMAVSVWRRCFENDLVDRAAWMEGRGYLAAQRIPFLSRAGRMYLLMRWPREMTRKGSRTVQNTPTRPGAAVRKPRRVPAGLYEFPA